MNYSLKIESYKCFLTQHTYILSVIDKKPQLIINNITIKT